MAVTINGDGTIIGVSVGGLPDGVVDSGTLATGIDATKLADGTITNSELQYINSLSSNAQTQISGVGGGKVLQCVGTSKTDTQSGNADSWVTVTGLTQAITPSATSSKILVMISLTYQGPTSNNARFKMVRTAPSLTDICVADASGSREPAYAMMNRDASQEMDVACMVFLDSPSTTSAVTYGAQCRATHDTQTWYINDAATSDNAVSYSKGASTITCIEIGV